jgi:hypothetical protein
MHKCQKRPITVPKETYYSAKRDLLALAYLGYAQVPKETYYSAKRDLL